MEIACGYTINPCLFVRKRVVEVRWGVCSGSEDLSHTDSPQRRLSAKSGVAAVVVGRVVSHSVSWPVCFEVVK